jgi:hypothetical protein
MPPSREHGAIPALSRSTDQVLRVRKNPMIIRRREGVATTGLEDTMWNWLRNLLPIAGWLMCVACGGQSETAGGSGHGPDASDAAGAGGTRGDGGLDASVSVLLVSLRGQGCLASALPVGTDGSVMCRIAEAVPAASAPTGCSSAGRAPADDALVQAVRGKLAEVGACASTDPTCSDFTVCQLAPAVGQALTECLQNPTPDASVSGWCYVDPAQGLGTATAIPYCSDVQPRTIRVLGAATPVAGSATVLVCDG